MIEVTFLPVGKQIYGYNCGFFALGYASNLLDGKSPVDARLVVNEMRNHFMKYLTDTHLHPFPTLEKLMFQATNLNFLIVK